MVRDLAKNQGLECPTVSLVVAARNDDYGGNFLQRMEVFVNCVVTLAEKHDLAAELIIVEWNPPSRTKSLSEAVMWPRTSNALTIRLIHVPTTIHRRFPHWRRMPLFEYLAKNVGIRRAKGQFILATNPDLLFSEALIKFLASGKLSEDCFYRVDRLDVVGLIRADWPLKEQFAYAKQHCTTLNALGSSVAFNQGLPFWLASHLARRQANRERIKNPAMKEVEAKIHTNASGDFLLMSRSHWHHLRGYVELPTHSLIDGYAVCMAASLGLKQVILGKDCLLFHQEHGRPVARRPRTSYQVWKDECQEMLLQQKPLIKNDDKWGLASEVLPELTL